MAYGRGGGAAAAIAAVGLALGAGAAEGAVAPAVGHYEARAADGAYLTFYVRARGGGPRVEDLTAYRRCGGDGDTLGNVGVGPVPVRAGAFALPARLMPLFNVRGAFTARTRATVRVGPSYGCASRAIFRARRVPRRPVVMGEWTGRDASGRPVTFRVARRGGALAAFRVTGQVRCARGALTLGRAPLLAPPVPVRAARAFSVREERSGGYALRALGGRFTGPSSATGSFRVVAEDGGCDSGRVDWTAAAPRPA